MAIKAGMRVLGAMLLLALAIGGAIGCGGSGSSSTTTTQPSFDGTVAKPTKPVPPLQLDNSLGQPVNIDDYRGKAVLVTFIYDHCPDICR